MCVNIAYDCIKKACWLSIKRMRPPLGAEDSSWNVSETAQKKRSCKEFIIIAQGKIMARWIPGKSIKERYGKSDGQDGKKWGLLTSPKDKEELWLSVIEE